MGEKQVVVGAVKRPAGSVIGLTNGVASSEYADLVNSRVWTIVGFVLTGIVMYGPELLNLDGLSPEWRVGLGAILAAATFAYKGFVSLGYIQGRVELKRSIVEATTKGE